MILRGILLLLLILLRFSVTKFTEKSIISPENNICVIVPWQRSDLSTNDIFLYTSHNIRLFRTEIYAAT